MFRNESAKVERRVRLGNPKKHAVVQWMADAGGDSASAFPDGGREEQTAAVERNVVIRHAAVNTGPVKLDITAGGSMYGLMPSADDRAAGFFFTNFCNYVTFNTSGSTAHADLGADIWTSSGGLDEHLYTSMKAVGLYGLFHQTHNASFEKLAWRRYLDAIRVTNAALRDPSVATKDSSLLAVIILGMFENISGRGRESLVAWEQHVKGAAALLRLRGRAQLATAVGRRMLLQITSNLLISCIQRDTVFPAEIRELMDEAIRVGAIDPANPLWRLRQIMFDVANFRAYWHECSSSGGGEWDCRAVVDQAQALDAEILALTASLPPSWQYRTVHTDDDPEIVVGGSYHVYPGYWQAQVWNTMRTCRLLLHGTMRKALLAGYAQSPPAFTDGAAFAACTATLYALQREVQTSVPQHIGYLSAVRQRDRWRRAASASSPSSSSSSGSDETKHITRLGLLEFPWSDFDMTISDPGAWDLASTHLPVVRTSGSTLLLWTVFLVGNMDVTTAEMRAWATVMLGHIGDAMGLRQASVLADILREREGPDKEAAVEAVVVEVEG